MFSQKWLISTPRKGCRIFKCCGFLIYRDCLITLRIQSSLDLSFGLRIFSRSGRSYSRQRLGVTPSAEAKFCWIAMHVLKYSSKANTVSALCDWMNSLIAILDSSCLKCPLAAWSNTVLNFFRISSFSRVCWLDCICSKRVFWFDGSASIDRTSFLIGLSCSSLSVFMNSRL